MPQVPRPLPLYIALPRPIPTTFRESPEGNTQLPCWTIRSSPSHKLTIPVIVFYMHRSALCVCAAVVIGDAVCFSIGSTLPQLRRSTSRYLSNAYVFGCVTWLHRLCLCWIVFCQGLVYVCHLSWILSNNLFIYTLANAHSQNLTHMTQS